MQVLLSFLIFIGAVVWMIRLIKKAKGEFHTDVILAVAVIILTTSGILISLPEMAAAYDAYQPKPPERPIPAVSSESPEEDPPMDEMQPVSSTVPEPPAAESRNESRAPSGIPAAVSSAASSGPDESLGVSSSGSAADNSDQGFVFKNSSTELLTETDLSGKTMDELYWGRNEIYARHGRKFEGPVLQGYFDARPWYSGTVEPERFDENVLNDTEKQNIRRIQKAEMKNPHAYYDAALTRLEKEYPSVRLDAPTALDHAVLAECYQHWDSWLNQIYRYIMEKRPGGLTDEGMQALETEEKNWWKNGRETEALGFQQEFREYAPPDTLYLYGEIMATRNRCRYLLDYTGG